MANNGTPSLDLAMRISADMGDAVQEATQLEAALDQIEGAGKKAATGVDATAKAADKAAAAMKREAAAAAASASRKDRLVKLLNTERGARIANAEAARREATEIARGGLSAKQQAMAMRQLPMQVTDIVTGLASGQSPMMVLIQQGGQLKDSFGGVVPAARALLGAISPLAVGLAAAGGAVAVVTAGMVKGYKEIRAYDEALISTGGSAGKTAGQLADMGDQIGAATGRYGDADAALLQLAQSGKVAGDSLDEAASAAVNLAKLTGDSIEATTDKVIELADAPTKTLLKLNDQYHFLTVKIYEQVKALEDQGRAEDAARLAIEEFARIHEQRVLEAEARAGYLERAWKAVGETVAGVWDDIKSLGRTDVEGRLASARSALQNMRDPAVAARGMFTPVQIKQQEELVKQLEAEAKAAQESATAERDRQAAQDKAVKAAEQVNKDLEQGATKAEKYQAALKKLKAQFRDLRGSGSSLLEDVVFGPRGTISGGAFDKRLAQLNEEFKETPTKPKKTPKEKPTEAQKDEAAAQKALENLKQQITLLGDLEEGETRASEAARMRFETTEGDYKGATAATKQQLLDQAQLLDTERLRVESAKKMVDVQLEIARLQGRGDDGELEKARKELGRLQADLEKLGKTKEAADVAKLLNLKEASVELRNLREVYDRAMGEIALEQQRIQVELQAGLTTEADAQQRIVDLYKEKLGTLKGLVPQMRAAAQALGDPAAVAAVEQIALKLQQMSATTNLLQQAVRTTFQESFKQALLSLVDGTTSLTEAVRQFFVSMAEGMAEFAAEQLSQKAANAFMTRFGDLADTASDTAGAAATTAAAAQLSAAGATVTAGGTSVTAGAAALTTSSTTLTTAGGSIMAGAAAVAAAAAQLQAAATTMLAANAAGSVAGFAEGGFTGYGGKYQFAGVVHKGEGVLNAAEIRALGGPRGFYALRDAIRNGFAEGGLVDAPLALAAPRYEMSAGSPFGDMPTPELALHLYNLFDVDEAIRRHFSSPKGDKTYLNMVGRNSRATARS